MAGWWEFPPGKSGGLIEAPMRCHTVSIHLLLFPPGKSGGLIEAGSRGRGAAAQPWFPPGKSGGLIEAATRRPVNKAGSMVSAG